RHTGRRVALSEREEQERDHRCRRSARRRDVSLLQGWRGEIDRRRLDHRRYRPRPRHGDRQGDDGRQSLSHSRRGGGAAGVRFARARRSLCRRLVRRQHRRRHQIGEGSRPRPHHRDGARRLRHALPVEAVQSRLPALEKAAGAGLARTQNRHQAAVRGQVTMPTDCLFRDDSYLKSCEARVVAITDQGGIVLDRTVFYANSGGQPGDTGTLTTSDGRRVTIANAVYTDPGKTEIAHVPAPDAPALAVGDAVTAAIDRDKRYGRMRMHTALHLLSAVLPYAVTGGSVGDADGRLDFDIPEAGLDKDAIATRLAGMIAADAAVSSRWISDAELEANPGLVKTMSVKPPMGT